MTDVALPDTCPACGTPDPRPWRRAPAGEPGDPARTYLLVRCAGCGSAATASPPPPPALYEGGAYRAGTPRGYALARHALGLFDRQRLALLARAGVRPPARLLDAGAGKGRFVAAARAAGYDATGIEPSARHSAPHVDAVAIEDARIDTPLDAVTLWHVLEHLEDPLAALTRIRLWLTASGAPTTASARPRSPGVLLVGVPNLASLQAQIGGARWYHLDLPRHRTHFTERGLRVLLERAGFRPGAAHHVLLEHNPFGLWQSAVSRATPTPSWLYHALKRNAPLRARDAAPTLAALPLAPLAAAAELSAGLARRGGTFALVGYSR